MKRLIILLTTAFLIILFLQGKSWGQCNVTTNFVTGVNQIKICYVGDEGGTLEPEVCTVAKLYFDLKLRNTNVLCSSNTTATRNVNNHYLVVDNFEFNGNAIASTDWSKYFDYTALPFDISRLSASCRANLSITPKVPGTYRFDWNTTYNGNSYEHLAWGGLISKFTAKAKKFTNISPDDSATCVATNTNLTWDNITCLAGYDIQISANGGASYGPATPIRLTTNSYSFPGTLARNISVFWRIRPVYKNNTVGTWETQSFTTVPALPTNVKATPSDNSAFITWNIFTNNALEYRGKGVGSWNSVVNVTTNSYTITGLTPCVEYEYRLSDGCGNWVTGTFITLGGNLILSGRITDVKNGQAIANAKLELNGLTTYTDNNGEYSFSNLCNVTSNLVISHLCYESKTVGVSIGSNNDFTLTPKRITISGTTNASNILVGNLGTYPIDAIVSITAGVSYSVEVNANASFQLTFSGFCLKPTTKNYAVCSNVTDNVSLSPEYIAISGNVGVKNATISSTSGQTTLSDAAGNYFLSEVCGFQGKISVYAECHEFLPTEVQLNKITNDTVINFTPKLRDVIISGSVSPSDATVTATNGTVTRNGSIYSVTIPCNSSTEITVNKLCYFTASKVFTNQKVNASQNFTLTEKAYSIIGQLIPALDGVKFNLSGVASGGIINDETFVDANGVEYKFNGVPCGANLSIIPYKEGYLFTPTKRDATNVESDLIDQNFSWEVDCNHPSIIQNPILGVPFDATCDLIKRNIIIKPQDMVYNRATPLKRYELAAILFKALWKGNPNAMTITDAYKVLYADLAEQDGDGNEQKLYRKWAKFLAYLEYDDAATAFDYAFYYFNGEATIKRKFFVKALMEALNIKPASNLSVINPFGDVVVTDGMYPYMLRAFQLGITTQATFRPEADITREEAFIMLWRCVNDFSGETPMPSETTLKDADNFFYPNAFVETSDNVSGQGNGISTYSIGALAVAHHGFPFGVSVDYSSARIELPKEFFPIEIFGRGWSHNYDYYILEFNDLGLNVQMKSDNRLAIIWGNAGIDIYNNKNVANPIPASKDNKSILTKVSATIYKVTTKGQITYTFERLAGGTKAPFLLTEIADRNTPLGGKRVILEYENALNPDGLPYVPKRLKRVKAIGISSPAPAYVYLYKTGTNLVESVQEENLIGRDVQFGYDGDKLVTFINANAEGNTTFQYGNGSHPLQNAKKVNKHGDYMLWRIKLPEGNMIERAYQDKKMIATQTLNNTGGTNYANIQIKDNSQGDKTQITIDEGSGVTRTYTYTKDANGNEIAADGHKVQVKREFNDPNNPSLPTKIVSYNMTTLLEYDVMGNLLTRTIIGTKGGTTLTTIERFAYNGFNDLVKYTDPDEIYVIYDRDVLGNLISIKPLGLITGSVKIDRKLWGGVEKLTDALGTWSAFDYDRFGGIKKSYNAITSAHNEIDAAGRLIKSYTEANGKRKEVLYTPDNLDRTVKKTLTGTGVTNPIDLISRFDKNSNLTELENDKGRKTTMKYDKYLDILKEVEFGGFKRKYEYRKNGALDYMEKCDEERIRHEYDADMLPTRAYHDKNKNGIYEGSDEALSEMGYDDPDRPTLTTRLRNEAYGMLRFEHDALNRLESVFDVVLGKEIVRYTYKPSGRILETIYNGGALKVENQYDGFGRLYSVLAHINGQTHQVIYRYYANNQLRQIDYPNRIYTRMGYDDARRLKSFATLDRNRDNKELITQGITYDTWNNPEVLDMEEPLKNVIFPTHWIGKTLYEPNDDTNRLERRKLPDGTIQDYVSDKNGNTKSIGGTAEEYEWTVLDQLKLVKKDGVVQSAYVYDAAGNRRRAVRRNEAGTLIDTYEVRDLSGNLLYELDASKQIKQYYVYGIGLTLRLKADGDYRCYHANLQGSILAMTKPDGTISHKYAYHTDGYGTLSEKQEEDENLFTYIGSYGVMKEQNLYYMQARYMHAEDGRFLSEDPIWHANLYPYADNNPISNIDPKGTFAEGLFSAIKQLGDRIIGVGENIKTASKGFLSTEFLSFIWKTVIKEDKIELNENMKDKVKNDDGFKNIHQKICNSKTSLKTGLALGGNRDNSATPEQQATDFFTQSGFNNKYPNTAAAASNPLTWTLRNVTISGAYSNGSVNYNLYDKFDCVPTYERPKLYNQICGAYSYVFYDNLSFSQPDVHGEWEMGCD